MTIITVNASRRYDINIGGGIISSIGEAVRTISEPLPSKCAIVADSNVAPLYADKIINGINAAGIKAFLFTFPAGEASKSHGTLLKLYSFLAESEITRSDIIVALGGGVTGDLTGFAAAGFNRGVRFIQIPTSLLAMVDSSVGGKTAVDIPEGKNLVGAFWQPSKVLCDTDTLCTLPDSFFIDGMGEVVKYGAIRDEKLFELVSTGGCREKAPEIISRCVTIKRDVVERDEFDTGERMLLNFGHTLGHAIEKYNNYQGITHGCAVAIGMVLITRSAERHGMAAAGTTERLIAALTANRLPTDTEIPLSELYPLCFNDKKRNGGKLNVIIASRIGESSSVPMTLTEFGDFLLK